MPLVLAEDLGSRHSDPATLPGTDVIRFGPRQPTEALRRAAQALADLHTSAATLPAGPVRTGPDEAAKAAKRATTLGGYAPELAEDAARVAQSIGHALTGMACGRLMSSHGSYKPSQLLFRSDSVFVIDFDQFCEADGALDVGYFLAYLRPPGLWYRRAGTRAWFDEAAATFLAAYDTRLAERGVDAETRSGSAPLPRLRGCPAAEDRCAPGEPAAQPAAGRGAGTARRDERLPCDGWQLISPGRRRCPGSS